MKIVRFFIQRALSVTPLKLAEGARSAADAGPNCGFTLGHTARPLLSGWHEQARLLNRFVAIRRMGQDFADIHDVHLAAQILVAGIDTYDFPVAAEPRMQVNTKDPVHWGVRFQFRERNEEFGRPVIQKQILEAMDGIRVRDDPIAVRAWQVAIMAVKFRRPEKLLCHSRAVILEKKISLQREGSARCRVLAKVENV